IVETSHRVQTDLELASAPGQGLFTRNTDCRVLACLEESLFDGARARAAQIVLSPSGKVGEPGQVKLKLDDVDGFWEAGTGGGVGARRGGRAPAAAGRQIDAT